MIKPLSRRQFLAMATGLLAGGVGGAVYAVKIEPFWLEITTLDITLPHLDPAFEGYQLVQISDIHMGEYMTLDWLLQVIDQVNQLLPDVVVITGDLVTGRTRPQAEKLKYAFRQLTAPTYAVAGNHDHWGWIPAFREILRESGVVHLGNEVEKITRGGADLYLVGLDDVWMNFHNLNYVLRLLPPSAAAILLVHEPDYADTSAATGRFGLQLSGHSHGGQVRVPLVGTPFLPYLGEKYPRGWYQIEGMQLYTNRGLGVVNPPMRLGNRPEITLITLHAPT